MIPTVEVKKTNKLSLIAMTEFWGKIWSKLDGGSLRGISPFLLLGTPMKEEMQGARVVVGDK